MAILTTDFPKLTDDLQDIFNESAKNAIADMVGFQIFKVEDTNRLTYDHLILHGLGGVKKVAEGEDLASDTLVEGDNVTWTQNYYGGLVSVTKKMRKFDLYDQIEGLVRSKVDAVFNQIDQSMADVLLNGFSASNYVDPYGESVAATGYDGYALFYASHSNNVNSNVFSNIITYSTVNPVISREAIIAARVAARKYKDPSGLFRPINLDTIVCSPDKEDDVMRILNSDKVSGEFINDVNPLKGSMKLKVWEKLAANSAGTDTTAYWFINTIKALFNGAFIQCTSLI
jgi:hypothetical protein